MPGTGIKTATQILVNRADSTYHQPPTTVPTADLAAVAARLQA